MPCHAMASLILPADSFIKPLTCHADRIMVQDIDSFNSLIENFMKEIRFIDSFMRA